VRQSAQLGWTIESACWPDIRVQSVFIVDQEVLGAIDGSLVLITHAGKPRGVYLNWLVYRQELLGS